MTSLSFTLLIRLSLQHIFFENAFRWNDFRKRFNFIIINSSNLFGVVEFGDIFKEKKVFSFLVILRIISVNLK